MSDQRGNRAAFAGIFAVTLLALLSVGAVLPVLPRYVRGPLDSGNLAVGFVIGCYALTGLICRPFAGRLADARGRKPAALLGCSLASVAGLVYLIPGGLPTLILGRLILGAGEGMVFTAGSAWIVDLAPPARRGRVIGLYGLAVWSGLSLGPPIGELILHASGYSLVWIFAAGAPALGALVALRLPDPFEPVTGQARGPLITPEAVRPGIALALASVGYATVAGFVILHLEHRGIGHGSAVFGAFAAMVVLTRLVGGNLPDRAGPLRVAMCAGAVEAAGLATLAFAQSLPVAIAGALAMGAAFSLLYPSLSLVVVAQVSEQRRGAALGTFTAFFDAGVGFGAPLAGGVAALAGYQGAFIFAAGMALCGSAAVAFALRPRGSQDRSATSSVC